MDTIELLTSDALYQALRAWRRGEPAPNELLKVGLLSHIDASHHLTRDVAFYDCVAEVTQQHLEHHRYTARCITSDR